MVNFMIFTASVRNILDTPSKSQSAEQNSAEPFLKNFFEENKQEKKLLKMYPKGAT
jgi:hypothetical protein